LKLFLNDLTWWIQAKKEGFPRPSFFLSGIFSHPTNPEKPKLKLDFYRKYSYS